MQYLIVKFHGYYRIHDCLSIMYRNYETFNRFIIHKNKRVYLSHRITEYLDNYSFSSVEVKSILKKTYLGTLVFETDDLYELIKKYNKLTKK